MKQYFEIGLNSYGFKIETGLVDLYIDWRGLTLALLVVIGLRVRKVLKTRKASK